MANTYALNLSGSAQYISRADSAYIDIDDGWTIEFWYKQSAANKPSTGTLQSIFYKHDGGSSGIGLFIDEFGKFFLYANSANNNPTTTIDTSDNVWHHIALVMNGASSKIYIDGTLNNGTQTLDTITTNSETLYIGKGDATFLGSLDFKGRLDDIRIWNDERTLSEIQNNKNLELTGSEDGLQVYLKLNADLNDATGHGQTFTNNNATYTSDIPFQGEFRMTCDTGNYTLTGIATNFSRALSMTCATGSYLLTGNDANLSANVIVRKVTTSWTGLTK